MKLKLKKNSGNDFIKYSSIGIQMFLIIALGTWGGIKLDEITDFYPLFMGSTGVKLLIYMGTLFIMAFTLQNDPLPFIIGFFILCLFYSIFEIITFLKQSKQIQN